MSQTRSLWRQVSHFRGDCAENRYWSVRLPVKWARPILGTCRTPTLAPTLRSSRILDDGRTEMNAGCIHEFWVRRAREGAQLSGGCCFGCAWHLAVPRISCQCEINVGGALSTAAVAVPSGYLHKRSIGPRNPRRHNPTLGTAGISCFYATWHAAGLPGLRVRSGFDYHRVAKSALKKWSR
jgi:hypothetical protein